MDKKYFRTETGKLASKPLLDPPKHVGYTSDTVVKIEFGISKCRFVTPYPKALDNALSAPHPGYVFTPSFKAGHWDGMHHFITRVGYFPTGLLPVVIHILKTGNNPLIDEDKDGYKVLKNPVKSVEVIPLKEAEKFYYPGLENYYENRFSLLENLTPETGEFTFPKELLKEWLKVKNSNPLTPQVLGLAASLHENSKNDPPL
jgi:hypothetical protein